MQRPRSTEGDEREVARIVATLDGHHAQRTQHLRVDDIDRRLGIDPRERMLRRAAIEHEPARKLGRQPAEQEVRVGDRRPAARPVTRRAGLRPRTLGADTKCTTGIDPNERTAAGSHRVQVDGRQPNR